MGSLPDDRTSRAVIRDEALRLFAVSGPDAVTIRDIARAAGVSPALVVRHYQSKDGLRDAVDDHVARVLEAVLAEMVPGPASGGPFDPAASALFGRLHAASERTLGELARLGLASAGKGPAVRAAFLLVNDLAVLMLRARLADILGIDPLSPAGLRRWGA